MKYIIHYSLLSGLTMLLSACGSAYQSVELPLIAKPSNYYHLGLKRNNDPQYHLLVKNKTISLSQLSAQGMSIPSRLIVDGEEITPDAKFSIGDLYSNDLIRKTFKAQKNGHNYSGNIYIYQMPYSVIIANRVLNSDDPTHTHKRGQLHIDSIIGLPFYQTNSNATSSYRYIGKAYYQDKVGNIKYLIKFTSKDGITKGVGNGQITGFDHYGRIELEKGDLGINSAKNSNINFHGNSLEGAKKNQQLSLNITGKAKNSQGEIGSYALGIYGIEYPNHIMGGVIDKKTQEHIFFGAERK